MPPFAGAQPLPSAGLTPTPLGTPAVSRYRDTPPPRPARPTHPSDLSGAGWALIEPTLAAWRAERRRHGLGIGRPPATRRRLHPARRSAPPPPAPSARTRPPSACIIDSQSIKTATTAWSATTKHASDHSEAAIHITMIDLMSRRLTGESTPTEHGT
ncbi:hypothetical protein Psi01_76810 [Planobispora siamensis]|uniref:Transposase n=1 Tax=Planobispora siamensis TaxID=936338 RepID=A0A8J3WRN2_9ACTN|nr:hypothetical protein Psi01_76810 [Planobispora siamensis]